MSRKPCHLWLALGVCLVLWMQQSQAQSVSTVVGGIASTPTQPSASNVFWNPAVIGFVSGITLETNLSLIGGWFIYDRAGIDPNTHAGYKSSSTDMLTPNPFVAISSDFGHPRFRAGYATYIPTGAWAKFDPNGAQRYDLVEGLMIPWNHQVSLAYKLRPDLSIGISGIYSLGFFKADLKRDLSHFARNILGSDEIPEENPLLSSTARLGMSNAHSFGGSVGVLYWPRIDWAFGLSFFSPMFYYFEGPFTIGIPDFVRSIGTGLKSLGVENEIEGRASTTMTIPAFLQMGIRHQPRGFYTGQYFARYVFGSWTGPTRFRIEKAALAGLENYEVKRSGPDDSYSFGTVQALDLWRQFQFGFNTTFSKSGVDDKHLSPSRADFDSLLLGVFADWKFKKGLIIGLEYSHTFMLERNAKTSQVDQSKSDFFREVPSQGRYRAGLDRLGLSVRYAF